MLKKSFLGLTNPRIEYELLPVKVSEPERVAPSKTVTLFHLKNGDQSAAPAFQTGDRVKTGQKMALFADEPAYVISSVTGTISSISPYTGDFGKTYSAITIAVDENEELDDPFDNQTPDLETAIAHLSFIHRYESIYPRLRPGRHQKRYRHSERYCPCRSHCSGHGR